MIARGRRSAAPTFSNDRLCDKQEFEGNVGIGNATEFLFT